MKVGCWVAVGLMAAALPVYAAEESAGTAPAAPASPAVVVPGGVVTNLVTLQAKVVAIDLADRKVTLEKNGKKVTLTVDKSVVNLPQVKVGDLVQVHYLDSVAISVVGPGETPTVQGGGMVALAPKGQMPGGIVAKSVQVTAKILKIKPKKRKVLLEWPDGSKRWIKAGQQVEHFDKLKVHDQVVVTYTEAVAIDVQPPAPKSP